MTIYSKFAGFWVGIHDKTWEGKFSYESDGKSIVWKDWLDGQPNNKHNNCYGDEDCVEVGSKGKWNDQCCGKAKPYVCEKKAKTCKNEDGKLKCPKEKSPQASILDKGYISKFSLQILHSCMFRF